MIGDAIIQAVSTVTQPVTCTMSNSATQATVTLSGGSPSPTTVLCDGISVNVTVNPSITLTATEPADGTNTRYRFSVSGSASTTTTVTTCASGTCTAWTFTNYYQLNVNDPNSIAFSCTQFGAKSVSLTATAYCDYNETLTINGLYTHIWANQPTVPTWIYDVTPGSIGIQLLCLSQACSDIGYYNANILGPFLKFTTAASGEVLSFIPVQLTIQLIYNNGVVNTGYTFVQSTQQLDETGLSPHEYDFTVQKTVGSGNVTTTSTSQTPSIQIQPPPPRPIDFSDPAVAGPIAIFAVLGIVALVLVKTYGSKPRF